MESPGYLPKNRSYLLNLRVQLLAKSSLHEYVLPKLPSIDSSTFLSTWYYN